MDFYVISTLKNLNLSQLGDRYFCLAHFFLKDETYRNYFLNIRKMFPSAWITLDNSAAERSLVTEDALISVMKDLQPNEVIAPDVLFNKDETIKNLDSFIARVASEGLNHIEVFGCPQGKDLEEYLACYKYMLKKKEVKTIGLSKITVPYVMYTAENDEKIKEARQEMLYLLYKRGLVKKPLHLLGMGDPREYEYYRDFPAKVRKFIRSSDSCYCVLAAVEGVNFMDGDFKRIPTYEEFYNKKLTAGQVTTVIDNVAFLKGYNYFN